MSRLENALLDTLLLVSEGGTESALALPRDLKKTKEEEEEEGEEDEEFSEEVKSSSVILAMACTISWVRRGLSAAASMAAAAEEDVPREDDDDDGVEKDESIAINALRFSSPSSKNTASREGGIEEDA